MRILTARHVLPVSSSPIEDGAIAFDGPTIVAVGPRSVLTADLVGADVEDLGNAAIIPGLVNCHSHLELTALRNSLDDAEHDFRTWLLRLNSLRAAMSDEDLVASAVSGAREGAAAGVTCFGDIGRMGNAARAALRETGLRGIVFQETEFSPANETAEQDFLALAAKYEEQQSSDNELIQAGISPHSPYTVSSRLFELIAQYAILNRVPLSIHAAESADEDSLLRNGEGFFAELYESFGFEWHSPGCSPIQYLERLGVLSTRPLLAHCVTVDPEDIRRIAASGAKIAHCPKSNAKFGHGRAPLESFLDAEIAVGFGSDSVASNNVCDIFEEARFGGLSARGRAGSKRFIPARELLRTATLGGAAALGLDDKIGTLEVAKQADLAVVSLDAAALQPLGDIDAALIFAAGARDVTATFVAGREVFRRG